jgi:branched-chain amino acid transport system permease protein
MSAQKVTMISVAITVFFASFFISNGYMLNIVFLVCMYSILAQSWDILFGYTGITGFAHAAFLGIGAYTSALLALDFGLSPWLGLIIGGIAAASSSIIIGISTLRIKIGAFVATTTIAFNQIAMILIQNNVDITKGTLGLTGIPSFPSISIGRFEIGFGGGNKGPLIFLIAIIFSLSSFFFYKLTNSRIGLRLRSIREDADAAESIGINVTKYKIMIFFASAFFAGMCGSLYAHFFGTIDPNLLNLEQQILIMVMVIAGGRGTLYGPILFAVVLIPSMELLRPLGPGRFILYGMVLLFALRFAERGIFRRIVDEIGRFVPKKHA